MANLQQALHHVRRHELRAADIGLPTGKLSRLRDGSVAPWLAPFDFRATLFALALLSVIQNTVCRDGDKFGTTWKDCSGEDYAPGP